MYQPFIHPFTFGEKYNRCLWTIDFELMGSFLTFSMLLILNRFNKNIRLAVLLSTMILLCETFYGLFLVGMTVADLVKNWKNDVLIKYKNHISYVLLFPAIYLYSCSASTPWDKLKWNKLNPIDQGYVCMAMGAILLFIVVCMNSRIQKLLLYNRFLFLGKISYSMYATHTTVCAIVSSWLIGRFLCNYFEITPLFRFLVYLPIIFVTSYLIDKYIDKPCIKFSSWFAKKAVGEIQFRMASSKVIRYTKTILSNIQNRRRLQRNPVKSTENI